jgi:hypothetical protein
MTNNFEQLRTSLKGCLFFSAHCAGADIIHSITPKRLPSRIERNNAVIGE